MEVSLIFPHQLVEDNPIIKRGRPIYLIEEKLFFTQYKFHQVKLAFHRASMKQYAQHWEKKGHTVHYVEATEANADVRQLIPKLKKDGVTAIYVLDVVDNWLQKRLQTSSAKQDITINTQDSPTFMLSKQSVHDYFAAKKKYFQTDFYIQQRKQFSILVSDGKPIGGQWSFDADNRLKYPKNKKPPTIQFPKPNAAWLEAMDYLKKNFGNHYGSLATTYPTTFKESKQWLEQFLEFRFHEFGAYEDAIVQQEIHLHHSILTPLLNVGLLTPAYVIDRALAYGQEHNVPLNSLEGFVRQIIGWREFIRGIYQHKGTEERTRNYWKFSRKMPESFWTGTTGITPIDTTIKKVLQTGYCHHIERLMVLGNFMLLCEFDPDEVYVWFMTLFIDGYDWVMVPNVYGMSQFADGGLMATKPYISGSNYLMKMSDYAKGDWQPIWDGLFWRFMDKHRDFFLSNPRLGMLIKTFDKMPEAKRKGHLRVANQYLKSQAK
jgi:deoxyribodipyrimidine photolyase-related protein